MAAFLNSFPLIMDDTRKANYKDLPQIFTNFRVESQKGELLKKEVLMYLKNGTPYYYLPVKFQHQIFLKKVA